MNDSKSIVVCEECSRKMRRRPHKFEEYVLYMIPDVVNCGVCRKLVLEAEKPLLLNLGTRLFAYTYRTINRGWLPQYTNVWSANGTSTLDWPVSYTFG